MRITLGGPASGRRRIGLGTGPGGLSGDLLRYDGRGGWLGAWNRYLLYGRVACSDAPSSPTLPVLALSERGDEAPRLIGLQPFVAWWSSGAIDADLGPIAPARDRRGSQPRPIVTFNQAAGGVF